MSATLADFLRERAAEYDAQAENARRLIAEWRPAVERLLTQIEGWLREADPEGRLIEFEVQDEVINEPKLGRYKMPRLDIRALGRWVAVVPKARLTVGSAHPPQKASPERATGRVDITNELRRFVLYRASQPGEPDVWVIDEARGPQRPFDREAFEAAFMSYLR